MSLISFLLSHLKHEYTSNVGRVGHNANVNVTNQHFPSKQWQNMVAPGASIVNQFHNCNVTINYVSHPGIQLPNNMAVATDSSSSMKRNFNNVVDDNSRDCNDRNDIYFNTNSVSNNNPHHIDNIQCGPVTKPSNIVTLNAIKRSSISKCKRT